MFEHREQVSADAAGGQWVLPGYYWAGVESRLPTQPPWYLWGGTPCYCSVGVSSPLSLYDSTLPGKGGVLPCYCWAQVECRLPAGLHCPWGHLVGMEVPDLL